MERQRLADPGQLDVGAVVLRALVLDDVVFRAVVFRAVVVGALVRRCVDVMTRVSPTTGTALLTAVLAVLGSALTVTAPATALIRHSALHGFALAAVLAGCFAVAELALLHLEFRREAYSFSLAGIPLLAGLLLLPARDVAAARMIGVLIAFAVQRPALLKGAYNAAAYVFQTALAGALLTLLLEPERTLDLPAVGSCLLVMAGVDLLLGVSVLGVIRLHQGRVTWRDARSVLLPTAGFSLAAGTFGLCAVLLLEHGAVGTALLLALSAIGLADRGAQQTLHRRHRALAQVHAFIEHGFETTQPGQLAVAMLERARDMMRARSIEIIYLRDGRLVSFGVDETGRVHRDRSVAADDWLVGRLHATSEPELLARGTHDEAQRVWLARHGLRDALAVSAEHVDTAQHLKAVVVVADRLGDTGTFVADDVTLLQTLAGHLSVALRNSMLMEQLRYDAEHDALTGLANRTVLRAAMEHLTPAGALPGTGAGRSAGSAGSTAEAGAAVLLLDVDRFKEVNDTLGHHVGDAFLVVLADRLRACVPGCAAAGQVQATIARLGGDEFAVLLTGLADATAQAVAAAQHIAAVLNQPVHLADAVLSSRVSIGVAVHAPHLTGADLLRHADTAMYSAKSHADAVVVYAPSLDAGRAERLALLADLHLAVERDEFEMRYQPKVDLRDGRITGVEALVRWQHPRLGLLAPDAFIGLAESTGLVQPLTALVLRKALAQCRAWLDAGFDITMAVNLSARSVSIPALPEIISTALAEAGLTADRLILEITESSALGDPAVTIPTLERLAALGLTLSLDDFGTGHSSLSYLHRLPVQEVKIDRSFVRDLADGVTPAEGRAGLALIRSILTLAATLQLRTVAEGIEDSGTLERLTQMGCDIGQGYHIARPMPPQDVTAMLLDRRRRQLIPVQERSLSVAF